MEREKRTNYGNLTSQCEMEEPTLVFTLCLSMVTTQTKPNFLHWKKKESLKFEDPSIYVLPNIPTC
jgi:hypothetical protein